MPSGHLPQQPFTIDLHSILSACRGKSPPSSAYHRQPSPWLSLLSYLVISHWVQCFYCKLDTPMTWATRLVTFLSQSIFAHAIIQRFCFTFLLILFPLSRGPKQPQFKDAITWYSRRTKEGLFPHKLPSFRRGTTTCRRGRIDLYCCAHSSYPSPLRFTQSADHHCGWSIRGRHLSGPCIASPEGVPVIVGGTLSAPLMRSMTSILAALFKCVRRGISSISSSSCAPPRSSHITCTVHKIA